MEEKHSSPKTGKGLRRSLIEYGLVAAVLLTVYMTGYHTQAIGTIQRGILATGLITPSIEIDYTKMKDVSGSDFYFADKDNNVKNLTQYKGKVVFLNIWASWCPPCIAEMPSIGNLYKSFEGRDEFVFLLVSMDEDFADARNFMESRGLNLPAYHYRSRDRSVFNSDLLPTTYVITPDGKIAMEKKGMAKYDTPAFKQFLEELANKP